MSPRPGRVSDVINSTLPRERPLDIRESPEFIAIAHRVREGLRAGHSMINLIALTSKENAGDGKALIPVLTVVTALVVIWYGGSRA